jgi:hypothetical protein
LQLPLPPPIALLLLLLLAAEAPELARHNPGDALASLL